ncbi:MAG: DUF2092 domain-containing protein [Sphingomonadales bacterium]
MKLWILTPILGLVLGLGLNPTNGLAQNEISEDATDILRSMSDYMGSLESFSYNFDADTEVLLTNGQKLQISSSGELKVQRPDGIRFARKGGERSGVIYFDGTALTFYGEIMNVYFQLESPGTIDDAINNLRDELGVDAAGADLIYADLYEGIMEDVSSADYWGLAVVDGIEAHHLAFREGEVDWQIWVQTGETPVPLKYIITTKWMTGAPQHSYRLRDWNLNPDFASDLFQFTPPEGSTKVESISTDHLGEISLGEPQ